MSNAKEVHTMCRRGINGLTGAATTPCW